MTIRHFTNASIESGELKVGMIVRVDELEDVTGIWILLKNIVDYHDELGIHRTKAEIAKISKRRLSVTEEGTSLLYHTPNCESLLDELEKNLHIEDGELEAVHIPVEQEKKEKVTLSPELQKAADGLEEALKSGKYKPSSTIFDYGSEEAKQIQRDLPDVLDYLDKGIKEEMDEYWNKQH